MARILVELSIPGNCFHLFIHLGGTIADYEHKHTAFFHRTANFEIYSMCSYSDDSERQERVSDTYSIFTPAWREVVKQEGTM